MINIKEKFVFYASLTEKYIEESKDLRSANVPQNLFESMEYSLTAGGKRLRPALCMAAAEIYGIENKRSLPMALALEMFHTSSLILDDLPSFDNDLMRRGKPSNHAVFGETMATLAGLALQAQCIEFPLTQLKDFPHENLINAIAIFSQAMGPSGVCGGQTLDIFTENVKDRRDYVQQVSSLKTGALIRASVQTGIALGTTDKVALRKFGDYGTHLGKAFQIIDDILDVTSTPEELGKTVGKDAEQGKLSYVAVFGIEEAKKFAENETIAAKQALSGFVDEQNFLMLLPDYLLDRTK